MNKILNLFYNKNNKKINWRNILILIIVLIAIISIIKFYIMMYKSHKNDIDELYRINNQKMEQYKSESEVMHARVQELSLEKELMNKVFDSTLKSLSKELNISKSDISEYKNIILESNKRFTKDSGTVDIKQDNSFLYVDEHWNVGGYLIRDTSNYKFKLKFDSINYISNIHISSYYKNNKLYVDAWTNDKSSKITNLQTFRIKQKNDYWFVYGLQIGATYSIVNNKIIPYVGIGGTIVLGGLR